ncbi:MAG: hypothetical protein LIP04_10770 [Tannerellaceae bacterium]|nr:hypothetical protein [Tannerellaceae bacterium]
MKIAIRYFSKTGHMEKMAAVISEVTGVKAETIDRPITEDTDILFLVVRSIWQESTVK